MLSKGEEWCMIRRLLPRLVTVTTTVAVMAGTLFAVGVWRESADRRWCERAVTGGAGLGDPQLVGADLVDQQRSACARERQRQRLLFGAVWRKGGPPMAECGFELARLQMLSPNADARRAILEPYGLDDPDFSGGDQVQQDRFLRACLAKTRHPGA